MEHANNASNIQANKVTQKVTKNSCERYFKVELYPSLPNALQKMLLYIANIQLKGIIMKKKMMVYIFTKKRIMHERYIYLHLQKFGAGSKTPS